MAMPQKPTPVKFCEFCGKQLERKRLPSGKLMSLLHFNRQKYCNQICMVNAWVERGHVRPPVSKSSGRTRARRRKPRGPCEVCGKPNARDVHHRNENTDDNRPENLQRICRGCHNKIHRPAGACKICGLPVKGYGYCDKHYQRFKKWGDPLKVKDNQFVPLRAETEANPIRICAATGCQRPYHANGYCARHAQQARRGKLKV